jgi:hypothetical protein
MPPTAAMTGTLSCTVAALVALNPRKAVYQMAYPTPKATARDQCAASFASRVNPTSRVGTAEQAQRGSISAR